MRRHPEHISLPLLALLCLKRRGEIIDALGDLIVQLVHKIKKRAERKIGGRLVAIVGEAPSMEARLVRRTDEDAFSSENLFETVVAPLDNAPQQEKFVF